MEFHIHPDGQVFMRNATKEAAFHGDSRLAFEIDSGESIPALPAGMVEARVVDNIVTFYDAKQNAYPVEGNGGTPNHPWALFADRVLGKRADIAEAKNIRTKPLKRAR